MTEQLQIDQPPGSCSPAVGCPGPPGPLSELVVAPAPSLMLELLVQETGCLTGSVLLGQAPPAEILTVFSLLSIW